MRYAVLGGDMRYAHLTRMLQESGRTATGFLQEMASGEVLPLKEIGKYDCIISTYPMHCPQSTREVSELEIMENVASGSVMLLCGPKFPEKRRWDLQYVNLWEDEALLRENAWLTAEAAVETVISRLRTAIEGLNCMVVGYGRIGCALTEILVGLNAQVTVATGKAQKCALAAESGAKSVLYAAMKDALPAQKLIFSTPPARMLNRDMLRHVAQNAYIMDLASPPYGVDLDAAQDLKLCATREPGLPGRWCPLSAGRAVYNAVIRWEEGEKI